MSIAWGGGERRGGVRFDETKLEERMTLVAYSLEKLSIIQSLDRISMLEIFPSSTPFRRSILFRESR